MAQIMVSTKKKKPRNSCFLGCFGFSSESSKQKLSSDKVSKRSQWFSWAGKKRSTRKNVLVDAAASPPVKAKRTVSQEIHMLKPDKKLSTTRLHPVNPVEVSPISTLESDQLVQKGNKTRYDDAQGIILENRKSLSKLDSIDETTSTCQKELTTARKSTARRTSSHPAASPDDKYVTTNRTTKVVSSPPKKWKKAAVNGGGDHQQITENKSNGKFDSLVGMSIILITLMIMLFWGKLCAIVCTSAWFYFVPRFGARNKPNVTTTNDSDNLNSEEYKKKVVLEGLLQRNHRNGVGIM